MTILLYCAPAKVPPQLRSQGVRGTFWSGFHSYKADSCQYVDNSSSREIILQVKCFRLHDDFSLMLARQGPLCYFAVKAYLEACFRGSSGNTYPIKKSFNL